MYLLITYYILKSFLYGSDSKEYACNAGDVGSIPGSRRFFGEGHGNPLHYSCLKNPVDRGAWWTAVYGVAQSRTWLKWLSSSSSFTIILIECLKRRGKRRAEILLIVSYVNSFRLSSPQYYFRYSAWRQPCDWRFSQKGMLSVPSTVVNPQVVMYCGYTGLRRLLHQVLGLWLRLGRGEMLSE